MLQSIPSAVGFSLGRSGAGGLLGVSPIRDQLTDGNCSFVLTI
jgi:hypothetical protein